MNPTIAVVVPELLPVPPTRGGAVEYWVHEVTVRMAAKGQQLLVVSRPGESAESAAATTIRYRTIPWTATEKLMQRLKDSVSWKNPLRYVAKMQNVWSYGRRAARAVDGAAVVYLHNEPNVLAFLPVVNGRRVVLHMHNDHLSARVFRPMYRHLLSRASVVIFVSDFLRKRAAINFPKHAHRFVVVQNATDPDVFRPYGSVAWQNLEGVLQRKQGTTTLLYAGRLVPIKGVHVLIAAFQLIRLRFPDVRLVIAGSSFFDGAATTEYETRLRKLAEPVRDAIVFTGFMPHARLKYLYSVADLVVVPSTWDEPAGLVVLEAMSAGATVVATSVGGIAEYVNDGSTGMLVASDNAVALGDTVCALIANPAAREAMAAASRKTILQRYTWERVISEILPHLNVAP